jgi:hypothetical protein
LGRALALAVTAFAASALAASPPKAAPSTKAKAPEKAPACGAGDVDPASLYGPFPKAMQAELDKQRYDAGTFLPPAPFRWEPPPVLSEIDVPGTVDTNGIKSRFHVVEVGLSMEETYRHFDRSFQRQGLWVSKAENQLELGDGQVALTGYDPNYETSYTVILTPNPNGRTGVIMGEAYWKNATFKSGAAFAPLFPAAESIVTQNLEGSRSMAFRVRVKKEDVEAFYKAQFGAQGYLKQPDGTWTRGTQAIHLFMRASSVPGLLDVALVETNVSVGPPQLSPTQTQP